MKMMKQGFTLFEFVLVVIALNVKTHVDGYSARIWRSNTVKDPQCRDNHKEFPRASPCKSSKYGCCQDRVTPAEGRHFKGCAGLLKKWITEKCAATCGFCRAPSNPKQRCEGNKPIYGCCWNGDEATGPGSQGCAACVDTGKHVCNLLKDLCISKFYASRTFMEQHCPQTCGQCPYDCYDTKEKCSHWAHEGLCKRMFWNNFMKKHCPQSCGYCHDGGLLN
ncbi:hypothetical protein OS493_001820 [Desmophyllum pertusum]|uniref:ShKT domain-containing protein n=1 Tax=Desmophyllum pertusum TaxID=174260 RepID=A0A9X0CT36_9CNID|nr:hypothetical protein OS493_001820 [Desmophyllum pertusum]